MDLFFFFEIKKKLWENGDTKWLQFRLQHLLLSLANFSLLSLSKWWTWFSCFSSTGENNEGPQHCLPTHLSHQEREALAVDPEVMHIQARQSAGDVWHLTSVAVYEDRALLSFSWLSSVQRCLGSFSTCIFTKTSWISSWMWTMWLVPASTCLTPTFSPPSGVSVFTLMTNEIKWDIMLLYYMFINRQI